MLENYEGPKFESDRALHKSEELLKLFKERRTVREFKQSKIDRNLILNALKMASSAPNGANKQPWSFCLIESQNLKEKIREISEAEERSFYEGKGNARWKDDIKHLHTNANKSFLTDSSFLLPIFSRNFEYLSDGRTAPNYFVKESVGIMTGFLISGLHQMGLSTLTYTPTRMHFLCDLLERPRNEKIFILLVIGISHPEAKVPLISKKPLDEVLNIYD